MRLVNLLLTGLIVQFMGQYIASSQPIFFLTQQRIYKSKIENENVSLNIFVSDTACSSRNLYLFG